MVTKKVISIASFPEFFNNDMPPMCDTIEFFQLLFDSKKTLPENTDDPETYPEFKHWTFM